MKVGSYHGAEVCELDVIFILYQLSRIYNKNDVGVYRDYGLAVFRSTSSLRAEKLRNISRAYSIKTIYALS